MKKITSAELDKMKIAELRVLGAELKLEGADTLKKPVLRQERKHQMLKKLMIKMQKNLQEKRERRVKQQKRRHRAEKQLKRLMQQMKKKQQ